MLRRLGFPDASAHLALVTGIGIDALGSGVFMPVSILFFLRTTDVPMADVGLALGVAGAIAIPFILVSGDLVDRFGARTVLLASNLIQAVGYGAYVLAQSAVAIALVGAVAAIGQSAFWSSYSPMVAAATDEGEREVWFGFLGALRNIGFALGGVVASAVLQIGTAGAFRALVLANAASYVLAFLVLLRVRAGHRIIADAPVGDAAADGAAGAVAASDRLAGSWGAVVRDRPYLVLIVTNCAYALCTISLIVAMPVYAVTTLGLAGWVSGALLTVNTVLVGFGQGLIVRAMDGHRRFRVIALGQGLYAVGFAALAACGWLSLHAATAGIFLAVAIYTLGEVLGGPPLSTVAVEAAPEALRGRYLAAYQLSWNAANIAAPVLLLGLLAHDRFSVWIVMVAVAGAGAALIAALGARMPAAAVRVTSAPSA